MNIFKDHEFYTYNLIEEYNKTSKYINLTDHSKYKYLLDMEGKGYSGRFPYLALTGSCIIILENIKNPYQMYYHNLFIEDIHYLKVIYNDDDDPNDIHNKILNKINSNLNDCKKISENCMRNAINTFTKDNIENYMAVVLNNYSKYYINDDIEYNTNLTHNKINYNKKLKFFRIKKF